MKHNKYTGKIKNLLKAFGGMMAAGVVLISAVLGTAKSNTVYAVPPHVVVENENQHTVYSGWDAVAPTITFVMGDTYYDDNGNVLSGNASFNQKPVIPDLFGGRVVYVNNRTATKKVLYGDYIGSMPNGTVKTSNVALKESEAWVYGNQYSFPTWPDLGAEKHYFIGWYTAEKEASINAANPPKQYSATSICDFTEDITLYAWWEKENHSKKIQFHLNNQIAPTAGERWPDGSNSPVVKDSTVMLMQTDTFDSSRITLSNGSSVNPFDKDGEPYYEYNGIERDFDGWWTEPVGGVRVDGTDIVGNTGTGLNSDTIHLYAHWKWGITYKYADSLDTAAFSNYTISGGHTRTEVQDSKTVINLPVCNFKLVDNSKNINYHVFNPANDSVSGVTGTWYCPDKRGYNQTTGSTYFTEGANITVVGNIVLYGIMIPDKQYVTYNPGNGGFGNVFKQEIPPTHYFKDSVVYYEFDSFTSTIDLSDPAWWVFGKSWAQDGFKLTTNRPRIMLLNELVVKPGDIVTFDTSNSHYKFVVRGVNTVTSTLIKDYSWVANGASIVVPDGCNTLRISLYNQYDEFSMTSELYRDNLINGVFTPRIIHVQKNDAVVIKRNVPMPLQPGETGIKKIGYDFDYWLKSNDPNVLTNKKYPGDTVAAGSPSMELIAQWKVHKYTIGVTEDEDDKINDLEESEKYDKLFPSDENYANDNDDHNIVLPEVEDKEYKVTFVLNGADYEGYVVYSFPKWTDSAANSTNERDKERVVKAVVKGNSYILYRNKLDFKPLKDGVDAEIGFTDKNKYLKDNLESTKAEYKENTPYSFNSILKVLGDSYLNNNSTGTFDISTLTFVPVYNYVGITTLDAEAYGYELLGFSEDPRAKTPTYKALEEIEVHRDMTLYTVWKPKMYTLVFDAQGGRYADDFPQRDMLVNDAIYYMNNYNSLPGEQIVSIEYGGAVPFSMSNTPVKTGYTFCGYYTEPDGQGVRLYDAHGSFMNDECSTTLGASYEWMWKYKYSTFWFYRYIYENFVTATNQPLPEIRRVYAYWQRTSEYDVYPEKKTQQKVVEGHVISNVTTPYMALNVSDANGNYDVFQSIPSTETLKLDYKYSPYVLSYKVLHNGGLDQSEMVATKVRYNVTVPIIVQTELSNKDLTFSVQRKTVSVEVPKWIDIYQLVELNVLKVSGIEVHYDEVNKVLIQDFNYDFKDEADNFIDLKQITNTSTLKTFTLNTDEMVANVYVGDGQVDKTSYNANITAEGPLRDGSYKYYYYISNVSGNQLFFGGNGQTPLTLDELLDLLAYNWALPDVLENGQDNTVKGLNDTLVVDTMDENGNPTGKIDLIANISSDINGSMADGMDSKHISCFGNGTTLTDSALVQYSKTIDIVTTTLNGVYDKSNLNNNAIYRLSGLAKSGISYMLLQSPQKAVEEFDKPIHITPDNIKVLTPVAVSAGQQADGTYTGFVIEEIPEGDIRFEQYFTVIPDNHYAYISMTGYGDDVNRLYVNSLTNRHMMATLFDRVAESIKNTSLGVGDARSDLKVEYIGEGNTIAFDFDVWQDLPVWENGKNPDGSIKYSYVAIAGKEEVWGISANDVFYPKGSQIPIGLDGRRFYRVAGDTGILKAGFGVTAVNAPVNVRATAQILAQNKFEPIMVVPSNGGDMYFMLINPFEYDNVNDILRVANRRYNNPFINSSVDFSTMFNYYMAHDTAYVEDRPHILDFEIYYTDQNYDKNLNTVKDYKTSLSATAEAKVRIQEGFKSTDVVDILFLKQGYNFAFRTLTTGSFTNETASGSMLDFSLAANKVIITPKFELVDDNFDVIDSNPTVYYDAQVNGKLEMLAEFKTGKNVTNVVPFGSINVSTADAVPFDKNVLDSSVRLPSSIMAYAKQYGVVPTTELSERYTYSKIALNSYARMLNLVELPGADEISLGVGATQSEKLEFIKHLALNQSAWYGSFRLPNTLHVVSSDSVWNTNYPTLADKKAYVIYNGYKDKNNATDLAHDEYFTTTGYLKVTFDIEAADNHYGKTLAEMYGDPSKTGYWPSCTYKSKWVVYYDLGASRSDDVVVGGLTD